MKLLWKLSDPSSQPPLLPRFFSSKSPSIALKNSDETPQQRDPKSTNLPYYSAFALYIYPK
ncbi:hypothetical protein SLEP1_g55340 [Rubroshorea leprosula]|uniref:Uncharacterized protein n=1 Tax=Rubroshorea leprosula TaxID=152421 RepID=A0AAV5MIA0_9ROSI|nr:hypothetical protein SLEP1_g55340 [Rubroshorea leprosula]